MSSSAQINSYPGRLKLLAGLLSEILALGGKSVAIRASTFDHVLWDVSSCFRLILIMVATSDCGYR